MNDDESLRRFGLVPADDALPEIRALLRAVADAERAGEDRGDDDGDLSREASFEALSGH